MSTQQELVLNPKLGLLELEEQLGNVTSRELAPLAEAAD